MSESERTDPPYAGTEAEILLGFLDYHRVTLRRKSEGLDQAALAQRLEPSTMTLGGMLKHLAYVEDWWLNQVFADNPASEPWASADWTSDPDWEWHSASEDAPHLLQMLLDEAIATSDGIVSQALAAPDGLDALSRRRSTQDPERRFSLRWILVHLIEEYSRHNGHADLIRESVDGTVGE